VANAVRTARTCYDHLAGMLGAGLMAAMLERGLLTGGDGTFTPGEGDRLSGPGHACDYALTDRGRSELTGFGIELDPLARLRRPLIRYCVDWSEQRHHLAGGARRRDRFTLPGARVGDARADEPGGAHHAGRSRRLGGRVRSDDRRVTRRMAIWPGVGQNRQPLPDSRVAPSVDAHVA